MVAMEGKRILQMIILHAEMRGLAVEDGWGQNPADVDTMYVHKASVCVSIESRSPRSPGLVLDSTDVPPGFPIVGHHPRMWIYAFKRLPVWMLFPAIYTGTDIDRCT